MSNIEYQIELIQQLFKCRKDVFAIRWKKGGKKGYMPAYSYDPYVYKQHKIGGGTLANFNDKVKKQLTYNEIKLHLEGKQFIGIYPLLEDNTSWFIVADFDKENWKDECILLQNKCHENNIPAYIERSRSGKGAHVWVFFEKPLPAIETRKVFIALLKECGIISEFDKYSSFDRLFPNQDYLSGKGFGNLIALPFNKFTLEQGNNCFVDASSFNAFENQWYFLEKVKLKFNDLEFHYGCVLFNYVDKETGELIEFSIDNDTIRPEFTILKSYFAKQLNMKTLEVDIYAEFKDGRLIAQDAISTDIDRINSEIIDSVKFQFLNKNILGSKPNKPNIVDLNDLQEGNNLYNSEEELINEILKDESVKHYRQIKYLLKLHLSNILKIRFILSPFSFVFLLKGEEKYHIVAETLNTEEATYIWHIDKSNLNERLNSINKDLNTIRNKGRQFFIEHQPENFSRIFHDYSDDKKGFMTWKDQLEERLI